MLHFHLDNGFSDPAAYDEYDWSLYGTIINAEELSADKCEIGENHARAWTINAQGPALLSRAAKDHHVTLVHASTDKVYGADSEAKAIAPESVYGQTKAAGDIAVANAPEHYILRRSESADSRNIVDTLFQLLDSHAEYGVYAVGD